MSLDVISIGTHGHLRSTGDILLTAVGSWGKFPRLGTTEFVVGIRQLDFASQVLVTYDIESNIFRERVFASGVGLDVEYDSWITAIRGFISAMLPPVLASIFNEQAEAMSDMDVTTESEPLLQQVVAAPEIESRFDDTELESMIVVDHDIDSKMEN